MRAIACVLLLPLPVFGQASTVRVVDSGGQPVPHVRVDCGDAVMHGDDTGRVLLPADAEPSLPSEKGFGPDDLVLRGRRTLRARVSTERPDRLVAHLDLARPVETLRWEYVESVRRLGVESGEPFEFRALRPAVYRLRVESREHQYSIRTVSLVAKSQELSWHLEQGVQVEGSVTFDLSTTKSLPAAVEVAGGGRSVTVDAAGRFRIPGFHPGRHRLRVRWADAQPESGWWAHERLFERESTTPRSNLTLVVRDVPRVQVRFFLPEGQVRPVDIEVRVSGSRPVQPYLFPLKVRLENAGSGTAAVTLLRDGRGHAIERPPSCAALVLEGIDPGPCRVEATAATHRADPLRFDTRETSLIEIALSKTKGRPVVFTGDTGVVTLEGRGGRARLTPEKRVGFLPLPPGRLRSRIRLQWTSDRYLPQHRIVVVKPSDVPLEVEFEKVSAPVLGARIITAEGVPTTGHEVAVGPPDWVTRICWSGGRCPAERMWRATVHTRVFEVGGLPPGRYGVVIDAARLPDFDLSPEGTELILRLPK